MKKKKKKNLFWSGKEVEIDSRELGRGVILFVLIMSLFIFIFLFFLKKNKNKNKKYIIIKNDKKIKTNNKNSTMYICN